MKFNLLFVDDDKWITDSMKNILDWESLSFNPPYLAYGTKEAQEIMESHPIHILISDIEMIGPDGFALLDWARENYPDTLRFFLTNHARFDYARRAIDLGVSGYLLKPVDEQKLTELLREWTVKLSHSGTETPEPRYSRAVREAIRYIRRNLSSSLSRESIARELYISESSLSRMFTKELGMSLVDYITKQRLEQARQLLDTTDLSVTEICARIGYNFPAYFTKIFKEKTGMTPSQYRESKTK